MEMDKSPPPYYSPAPPPVLQQPQVPTAVNVNVVTNPKYTGSCPICHTGKFTGNFTCCGWLLAILCFPCGIICCCCMRQKRCNHCGFAPS